MKHSSFFKKFLMVLALSGGISLPAVTPALADAMIMPIRIVFGSHDRMRDITVIDSSNVKSATYKLAWLNVRQTEDGGYKELATPLNPLFDPEKSILFSPRQVTLGPGGKQRIRLALRRPAGLPDGEYRAHLYLKSMTAEPASNANIKNGKQAAKVGMGMYVGLAVPVIIRQGVYDGTAVIGQPRFTAGTANKKTPPMINFTVDHGGKFSTIGNISVYWTPPDSGKEQLIARQNEVKIYAEVDHRKMAIPLKVKYVSGGTVRIVFEGDGPDKGIKFDEKTFPVGG